MKTNRQHKQKTKQKISIFLLYKFPSAFQANKINVENRERMYKININQIEIKKRNFG